MVPFRACPAYRFGLELVYHDSGVTTVRTSDWRRVVPHSTSELALRSGLFRHTANCSHMGLGACADVFLYGRASPSPPIYFARVHVALATTADALVIAADVWKPLMHQDWADISDQRSYGSAQQRTLSPDFDPRVQAGDHGPIIQWLREPKDRSSGESRELNSSPLLKQKSPAGDKIDQVSSDRSTIAARPPTRKTPAFPDLSRLRWRRSAASSHAPLQ